LKKVLFGISGVLCVVALGWVLMANNLMMSNYFSPKQEAVRRKVFEQSKAYNQGMIQELQNMRFEYIQAKPEQQTALRSIILHRAADYPADSMPVDLYAFIQELEK